MNLIHYNDHLISGLPNEVSLQCIPYFSCETLSALSRASKVWNDVTKKELFSYKYEIRNMNFILFQSMISIWRLDHQQEMDLVNRITVDQTSFGYIPNSLYSELLENMKTMAKSHNKTLFLFETVSNLNRFKKYACSHLLPLKNIICLSDANISNRLNVKSIGNKIDTLILKGTVCRNPIALECLEILIPQMKKIKTLIWSHVDLREDNEDNFAFEALSKKLSNIKNLTSLTIHDFEVNDMASKNLLILIKSFKKMESLILTANEVGDSQNLITDEDMEAVKNKFNEVHSGNILEKDPVTNEHYRKITWEFGM